MNQEKKSKSLNQSNKAHLNHKDWEIINSYSLWFVTVFCLTFIMPIIIDLTPKFLSWLSE